VITFRDRAEKSFTWLFAKDCTFRCWYCFGGAAPGNTLPKPRNWTIEQCLRAWRNVYDNYGEAYIVCGGLEPSTELGLVAEVMKLHRGALQTNLSFDVDQLQALIPPDRLRINPTFHAHGWRNRDGAYDIDAFVRKLLTLKKAGYEVERFSILAAPEYTARLAEWVERGNEAGLETDVVVMLESEGGGKVRPTAYSDEQWAELEPFVPAGRNGGRGNFPMLDKTKVIACEAGYRYAVIHTDGHITRCPSVANQPGSHFDGANFYRDGGMVFADEAEPCPAAKCICAGLDCYHVRAEEEAAGA